MGMAYPKWKSFKAGDPNSVVRKGEMKSAKGKKDPNSVVRKGEMKDARKK